MHYFFTIIFNGCDQFHIYLYIYFLNLFSYTGGITSTQPHPGVSNTTVCYNETKQNFNKWCWYQFIQSAKCNCQRNIIQSLFYSVWHWSSIGSIGRGAKMSTLIHVIQDHTATHALIIKKNQLNDVMYKPLLHTENDAVIVI